MGLFKQKLNPLSGQFNLVPKNTAFRVLDTVASYVNLPLTGNTIGDGRVTTDTGHLYLWSKDASSGLLTDWIDQGDLIDVNWDSLIGKPSSTPANIDDAVSKLHLASGQFNQAISGEIVGLTDKSIPLDADVTLIESDANANAKRKLSWLNIKSTLKTYFDTLYTIVNLGGVSVISVNTTLTVKASGGDFTTVQGALDSLKGKWINSDVTVTISVDPGLFIHTATILFRHPQGNRINLVGAAPVTTTLTSLVSFSGTTGNYSVTLNVANTAGMTIGDYCIIRDSTGTGEYRAVMGCWEITNIPSGTQIIVKNTYRKTVAPTLTITGGSLDCLKTILKFNGCDGILPGNSTGYIYNLAIVGNGTANTDGVNVSQRGYNYGNHIIYLGYSGSTPHSLGINGFGRYGVAQTSAADLWMWNVAVSNCGSYGVYAYNQAKIAGTGIISSGNVSIGVYATDGAWITAVSSFAIGNATVGFYAFNRAGINAENSEAVGNIYSGFQSLGTSYIYAKTTKALNNGYHGYSSSYLGMIYAQSSSAIGNGAAINYYGYWSSNNGHIRADSTTASGNFSGDYYAEHFSFIKVTSYVGSPTFSPAVDTMGNGGSIIRSVVATPIKIADAIKNTPAGNISSTDVQAAINELDTEKQASLGFTPEDVGNKRTTFQVTPDDTHYPSEKLVKDSLDNKQSSLGFTPEDISNKSTDTNLGTSDTLYPSQNAVKSYIDSFGLDATTIKDLGLNIMLNAFRIAQIGSLTIFNMVKGFMDEYEDESGVDLVNSTGQDYNSTDDYYFPFGGVVDSYTKLLLHFDGNFIDSSPSSRTIHTNQITTDQDPKFGTRSVNMAYRNGYWYADDTTDLHFGSNNWTIDWWSWWTGFGNNDNECYVFRFGGGDDFFRLKHHASTGWNLAHKITGGTSYVVDEGTRPESTGQWYHYALVRNGTNISLYRNGNVVISETVTEAIADAPGAIRLFGDTADWYQSPFMNLDEFRISNGIARWTIPFTPPSFPYGTPLGNMTLLSNAQVADSVPTSTRIVLFEEDVDSVTLNTDLKAYISRDNGTTYSQVTLEDEGNYITAARVLSGLVDISGQPSGSNIKYKIETLNNKNLKLHGVGISWK